MTTHQFVDILGATESDGWRYAWGDDGRAIGRFQAHPSWVWQFAHRYQIVPALDATWDQWVAQLVGLFFDEYSKSARPIEVAMHFHVGHECGNAHRDWDIEYAQRFVRRATQAGIFVE